MSKKVDAPHEHLTYRIIGAAMAIHRRLGPGHAERIYQRAMEEELPKAGLSFEAEKMLPVYAGDLLLGYYVPDLIVESKVVVELKAFASLHQKYLGQVITYLNHTGLAVGLLINFGERSLRPRRIFPSPQSTPLQPHHEWMFVPDWLEAQKQHETPKEGGRIGHWRQKSLSLPRGWLPRRSFLRRMRSGRPWSRGSTSSG